MKNIPVEYQYINAYNAIRSPSTVHVRNTQLHRFFSRYLLQKAVSVLKWELPKDWNYDYVQYIVFTWGYICILETDRFGVIPQACTLSGYDVFYAPNTAIVNNPLIKPRPLRIGRDCTLIKLMPDYGSIMDLVDYYADQMALTAESVGINMLNTHLAYLFFAEGKAEAESYKKMYDRIASGEPAVVVGKNMQKDEMGNDLFRPFQQNLNQVYISDKLLVDLKKIESMFDTDIGIPSANLEKRERLITDEVNANNVETASKMSMWLESLKRGCREANDMFDISMDVNWRVNPKTEIADTWEGGEA